MDARIAEYEYAPRRGRIPRESLIARSEVLRRNKLLDAILKYVPIFVGVLNECRQFVLVNHEFFRGLGIPEEDALAFRPGETLGCIHAHDAQDGCGDGSACRFCGIVGVVHEAFASGRRVSREARLTTSGPAGMQAWDLQIDAEPVEIDGERMLILLMRDIGASRQKEMMERIFYHDVMNSAAGLDGVVTLLEPWIPRTEETADLVDVMKGTVGEVIEQIRFFRKLSQAESGVIDAEPALVNVDAEVAEVAAAVDQTLRLNNRRVRIKTKLGSASLISDRVLVRRIVLNMLKNAAEASEPGETVTVTTRTTGHTISVSVHNPAVMSPEVSSQIFQRSFSTKGSNRGLGTYSMKLLSTRFLAGDVTFTSAVTAGTVFTLTLPITQE